ncbi:MAG: PEP-CTERM sorting domain-containing protein [Pirellulaceae bacterium]|nr:PEP-CTERM sorting domain-containing protein [Pirellulaceae bacterium]
MEYGVELQGSLTLADDAVIEMRADNTISGAISGDYVLWFRNRATSYASSVTLTNSANSTKGLNIASDGNTTAPVTVYLNANYTATEYVRIAKHGTLVPGTYLSTPRIPLDYSDAVLDVSAAGMTLVDGMTLEGRGTVTGMVTAAEGSMVSPGMTTGTLNITGDLDMSAGADMTWSLGTLTDNTTGVAGTDFNLLLVSGALTLGAASELTLDFTDVGDPSAAETFWSSDHAWTIATAFTLAGNFVSITNPTWATGAFATSIVDNNVLLNYVASTALPIPGDTNGDRLVDELDARRLAEKWGASVGEGGFADGDFNADGVVNALDASILAANWGDYTGGESTAAVPEPSSIVLLTAWLAMLFVRRRR